MGILSSPLEIAALKLTGNHVPATCRVEPSVVRTFDNMTLSYKINDCEHVLLMDGSKHIPVAITTKTVSGEKKIVKILSGITVLSNGVMVEVVAPQLLKSRAVGLCGDMNGERSADLKTPGQCVMRPHLAAVSYLINKSGSVGQ